MKTVRITHPEAGESTVPASAVAHWISIGWTPAEPEPEPAPPARGEKDKDKPSGRPRRRSSEGDE